MNALRTPNSELRTKVLGIIEADLKRSPLGLSSHQGDVVAGVSLLRRTVGRCLRSSEVTDWVVVCEADDAQEVGRLLEGVAVEIVAVENLRRPLDIPLIRFRKWASHTWRGGLRGAIWFDELIHAPGVQLAVQRKADAVTFVSGSAALTDPLWLDAAVRHSRQTWEQVKLTFTQAAPGLIPPVFRTDLLVDLLRAAGTIGGLFQLRIDDPQFDLTSKGCNLVVPMQLSTCPYRFAADSDGWAQFLASAIEGLGDADATAEDATAWAFANPAARVGTLPGEVDVEITSETNLSEDAMHFPPANGSRGRMSPEIFADLCRELAVRDDLLLNIGGFGEPLVHPDLSAMLAAAREAGVWGLSLQTNAVVLDGAVIEGILDADLDVLEVLLDAATEQTYRKLKGEPMFDRVTANIERFLIARAKRGRRHPLLVCRMVKTPEAMAELEPFYERWLAVDGAAVLDGYNDFAGQREDRGVINMAPPGRSACRRIFNRLTVLADGSITVCGQDYADKHPLGMAGESNLSDLWRGPVLSALRDAHIAGDYGTFPLCQACREWHRP